jgi:transcriptional regulator GlxA family with amidase domain
MACEASLSTSGLTVPFERYFAESPAAYAERLRLEYAASLIDSAGLTVQEAAAATGYSDPFHFSRRFAKRMGVPPSRWRSRPSQPARGAEV